MRQVRKPETIDPGFRSPDVQPVDVICARIYIPADQLHIAAFWSQVEELTKWLSWERGGTKAKEAAAAWRAAWELSRAAWEQCAGECGIVDVRQQAGTPCLLEKKIDCETWEQWGDIRLCVPQMRIAGGVIQQDTSGSGDWHDASDPDQPYDERLSGYAPPAWETPPPGEDGACLAAVNAVEYVYARVQSIAIANRDYLEFLTWFSVLVAALSLIVGVGLIIVILAGIIIAVCGEFVDDWADVVTYDFRDELMCWLWRAYADDGTMIQPAWDTLQVQILALRDSKAESYERVALMLAKLIVWSLGPVGMGRIANFAGLDEGTCDTACGWSHEFDFTTGLQDWTIDEVYGYPAGVYHAGQGIKGVYAGVLGATGAYRVWLTSETIVATEMTSGAFVVWYDPAEDYYSVEALILYNGAVVAAEFINTTTYNPPGPLPESGYRHGFDTGTGDHVHMRLSRIHADAVEPDQGDEGGLLLSKIVLYGTGTDPY